MNDKKALILDANILIRAVLGSRVSSLLAEMSPEVRFFTPAQCVKDAYHYLPPIFQQKGIDDALAIASLDILLRNISVMEWEVYKRYETMAKMRMRMRDVDDWHIVACALLLDCPVWTEDADFFGAGIAVWTTDRVNLYPNADIIDED